MAKIKICGLRRETDIYFVNELLPDFVGFISSGGFKRSIDLSTLKNLRSRLNDSIKAVGVFVDEDLATVNHVAAEAKLDFVQLHGGEDVDYVKSINAPVIKMLKPTDFDKINDFAPYVDYFLFDSGTGTGKLFDWSKIPKTDKPFFLAGGLNCENLEKAIKNINPFAVDMSSSVETDGIKDYDKIKRVIKTVRRTK